MNDHHRFRRIVVELSRLQRARDAVLLDAFSEVEARNPELATLVLQQLGERTHAARWMSAHRRAFGGLSAYEMLAEGEADAIWNQLSASRKRVSPDLVDGMAY
ncbi:DUF2384 domain-containing protein [Dyella sp. A6]|uniref:DUF2384 domain-containing protein n=1 Tax=Dyella aluminiiresistens TaxID=3069105 RepID=UPI002E77FC8D|nr:DUF2384 domain-containing protein [Dyella sp. A6]